MDDRSVYKSLGREEDLSRISKRVAAITVSAIKQMPVLASKVAGAVSLGQGIPSFATPPFVTNAVIRALREDGSIGKYSLQPGMPELKARDRRPSSPDQRHIDRPRDGDLRELRVHGSPRGGHLHPCG